MILEIKGAFINLGGGGAGLIYVAGEVIGHPLVATLLVSPFEREGLRSLLNILKFFMFNFL